MSYYMHLIPGRIQIRTKALKQVESGHQTLTGVLHAIHGVTSVTFNLLSGCLVISYDRELLSYQELLRELIKKGLFPAIEFQTQMGIPRAPFEIPVTANQIS